MVGLQEQPPVATKGDCFALLSRRVQGDRGGKNRLVTLIRRNGRMRCGAFAERSEPFQHLHQLIQDASPAPLWPPGNQEGDQAERGHLLWRLREASPPQADALVPHPHAQRQQVRHRAPFPRASAERSAELLGRQKQCSHQLPWLCGGSRTFTQLLVQVGLVEQDLFHAITNGFRAQCLTAHRCMCIQSADDGVHQGGT